MLSLLLDETAAMTSNLACVGLGVAGNDELASLVSAIRPRARLIGQANRVEVFRWEDESSGARLVLGIKDGRVFDLLPSLSSPVTTRLGSLRAASEDVATASVLDEDDEQLTSLAVELEQRQLLASQVLDHADAAIVAFGRSVSVYADEAEFGASRDSLVDPNADIDAEPPATYVERGLVWPPRMASESFIAYGVFPEGADARALARLNGVVVAASRLTTAETGQSFVVARVRTIGFEIDLCMSADEHPGTPEPGQVVGGEVFLVGSIPSLEKSPSPKKWWRRK